MDLREISLYAEEIARGAGEILLKGFRSPGTVVDYKSDSDLVTSADRESEEYLYSRIRQRYPDHAVVAEEGSRSHSAEDLIWYVDPLDGTNNFAHGIPMFCISIGVYSRRREAVVAGVVYDPFHDELFSAARDSGAFLNGERIRVSRINALSIAMLATGFPYDKATSSNNNLREFCSIVPRIQGIRRMGAAALDLSFVACGRFDGYWELKLKPWDSAAGSLLVEEAGGSITKYDGSRYEPEYPEIVASNGILHQKILDALQPG